MLPGRLRIAAIVITRVFVFGASVLLWSLALLLNNVKADWILLFASMCVIIIPRACLPFRVGDCMMNHVCFMAFNFFTPRPTWKISAMCSKSECPLKIPLSLVIC